MATTGWGRQLLDHQDPEGTWAHSLYSPKWISTAYTLPAGYLRSVRAST